MKPFKAMPALTPDLEKSFAGKVQRGGADDCWPWAARSGTRDYGRFIFKGQRWLASRIAYYIANRALAPTELVCHHCDNPPCCNPAHLFAGTHQDNTDDMVSKGRLPDRTGEASPRSILSEADVRFIRRSSLPSRELARHFGLNPTTIQKARNGKNWGHIHERAVPVRGRLTEADVREIRASRLPATHHAARLGVAPTTVRLARAGKTWGHVQ